MRMMLYLSHLLEKILAGNETYRYGSKLIRIPMPKCVCFYNGLQEQPDEVILKLSDAFIDDGTEPDVELRVRMLNINYGHNRALMEKCEPLRAYAWFVDAVRRHEKVMGNLEAALDAALKEMPDDFELKKFLAMHRAEVKGMFLTEWDEDVARKVWRAEAHEEGFEEGLAKGLAKGLNEGINDTNKRVASDMLKKHLPLSLIEEISKLSREAILTLAQSLGVTVA